MTDLFLIEKNGLYYRPNAQGYTGLKREAGRYSFEEAAERVGPNGPEGPQDGLSMWKEREAPEFSGSCSYERKLMERVRKEARNDALREAADVARDRYIAWRKQGEDCAVECDVTACRNIANAITTLIEKDATDG